MFCNQNSSSTLTKKILYSYFKCFNCNEIPSNPILLNSCNHFYCKNCLGVKNNINFINCPFCMKLNEVDEIENRKILLLINEINSMDDFQFKEKFPFFETSFFNIINKNEDNIKKIVDLCYECVNKKNNINNNNNNLFNIYFNNDNNNNKINNNYSFVFDLKKRTLSQLYNNNNNNNNKENYFQKENKENYLKNINNFIRYKQ